MAEHDEQHFRPTILPEEMAELLKAAGSDGAPVPDLIEQYRSRRMAWLRQADELARMREEVRSFSEREAREIVTKARRDVHGTVMNARHNLLVLSAHLQAALGEEPDLADAATPSVANEKASKLADAAYASGLAEDAYAQLNAFDQEVRTLPFAEVAASAAAASPAPPAELPARGSSSSPSTAPPPAQPQPERAKAAPGATMWLVGAALVVATIAALLLTTFLLEWLPSPTPESESAVAAMAESQAPKPRSPPLSPSTPAPQPSTLPAANVPDTSTLPASESVSLRIEARRDVWVRTIVDGRADAGRLLERGTRYEVSGERSVGVRVGDAGAVTVAVNRGEPQLLGRDGEVVTRSFGGGDNTDVSPVSANR